MNTDSWVKSVLIRSSLAQDVAANQAPQPPANPAYKTTPHTLTHAHTPPKQSLCLIFFSQLLFSIRSTPIQSQWKYVLCSLLQNTDIGCCFAYWQLWLGTILSRHMSSLNHLFQKLTHSMLLIQGFFSPVCQDPISGVNLSYFLQLKSKKLILSFHQNEKSVVAPERIH